MELATIVTRDEAVRMAGSLREQGFVVKHMSVYVDRDSDRMGHLLFRTPAQDFASAGWNAPWELYNAEGWRRVTVDSVHGAEEIIEVA